MSFTDTYTTADILSEQESILEVQDPQAPIIDTKNSNFKLERDKLTISNDAYAIGQLLERLENRLSGRF